MFCPECGRELDDNAVFCDECGFRITKETKNDTTNKSSIAIPVIIMFLLVVISATVLSFHFSNSADIKTIETKLDNCYWYSLQDNHEAIIFYDYGCGETYIYKDKVKNYFINPKEFYWTVLDNKDLEIEYDYIDSSGKKINYTTIYSWREQYTLNKAEYKNSQNEWYLDEENKLYLGNKKYYISSVYE